MRGTGWSRREFLKASAAAAVGGVLPFPTDAAAGNAADVSIAAGSDPAETARKAVALLGGMKAFVSKGDVVVLKPNIGWDRTPEQAASAVREFRPRIVYPYHSRGSDLEKFEKLVGDDVGVEVRLRDWYTHVVPLAETQRGFDLLASKEAFKVVVRI